MPPFSATNRVQGPWTKGEAYMPGEIVDLISDPVAEPYSSWHPVQKDPELKGSRSALMKALARAEFGSLRLVLPNEKVLHFKGGHPGEAAKLEVRDWSAFDEIINRGQLGFADGYIDGKLESENLADLVAFFLRNEKAIHSYFHGKFWYSFWIATRYALRANNKSGSRKNIAAHYNLGNDFYALWLDASMTYSSALFGDDPRRTLEQAQAAKYRRILDKLDAEPGAHILEIGCGWGGFAETAGRLGYEVTAVTISGPQADYAVERIRKAGLADRVHIEIMDYRDVKGKYDHIVSIGMFEHVGAEYWGDYFRLVKSKLSPYGTAMIQSIYVQDEAFERGGNNPGFIETYIFPGGQLPSPEIFKNLAEGAGLECIEQFKFGQDYKRTLQNWLARFESRLDAVRALGHDERFIRLWRLYLNSCIAAFGTQRTGVMQAELRVRGYAP